VLVSFLLVIELENKDIAISPSFIALVSVIFSSAGGAMVESGLGRHQFSYSAVEQPFVGDTKGARFELEFACRSKLSGLIHPILGCPSVSFAG
jgi:hypothetical protein